MQIVALLFKFHQKFVYMCSIKEKPAVDQLMAWRLTGDKPLCEPMIAQFTDTFMRHSPSVNLTSSGLSSWESQTIFN